MIEQLKAAVEKLETSVQKLDQRLTAVEERLAPVEEADPLEAGVSRLKGKAAARATATPVLGE